MLNENVKKVLAESMWDLATCADNEPNVVPVAFKDVTADGKLVVGDVFLETTLKNLQANGGKIAISALNDYITQKKSGKNPVFYASSIKGLGDEVEEWQEDAEEYIA